MARLCRQEGGVKSGSRSCSSQQSAEIVLELKLKRFSVLRYVLHGRRSIGGFRGVIGFQLNIKPGELC
jgi:hypothetical protein